MNQIKSAPQKDLSPEQQSMREKDAEQRRRTAMFKSAQEADQANRPDDTSIRALRGGLPGLGKRT
jgi:hypothetical protein